MSGPKLFAETVGSSPTGMLTRAAPGETVRLTLDDAVRTALENHPQYAAAQLAEFLAQTQVREVKANYFPVATAFITAGGATDDGTRLLAGGLNVPSVYDRVGGGVAVTQLVTDFGRTANLSKGAQAHAKGAASAAEATREQVILNAKTAYFAALQAQSVLSVARETRKERELVARQVQALANNKLKSSLDVSFAQVSLEEADLIVQQAEGQSDSAIAAFSSALGYRRRRNFVLTEKPVLAGALPDLNTAIDQALKQRPDLARLRYERDAAERVAQAEHATNFPTLSAVGTAGNAPWRDGRIEANYAAGAVQLSVPIFAGGAYQAKEKEARIRAEVAGQVLRQAEDDVARDVQIAWVSAQTALKRLGTTDQLVKHAHEAFALAQARYRAGSSSVIELSQAQLSETSASITQVNARYDALIEKAVLDYQSGVMNTSAAQL